MKIGYYPGCTLKNKAKNLEESAVHAMEALGYEMVELEKWNCCGAVYSLADDDLIHLLAPVRDLIRAKDQGFDKVVTICSMCYNTLARANIVMRDDEEKRKTINTFLEEESDYNGDVEVVHLLGFLRDEVGFDKLAGEVKNPLTGLKLAPYYGCTLTRPAVVSIDDNSAYPEVFKDFITALGAESVEYGASTECCGTYQIISNPDAAKSATLKIIGSAGNNGADAMILSCPLCEYNLGRKQEDMIAGEENINSLPVLYFTQLLAIALGLPEEVCKFEYNPKGTHDWLEEKGLLKAVSA